MAKLVGAEVNKTKENTKNTLYICIANVLTATDWSPMLYLETFVQEQALWF